MAARYALTSFWVTLASGAQHHVLEGSFRDSLDAAVVAYPAGFGTTPPVTGQGHITGKLGQHLAAYPRGSEL